MGRIKHRNDGPEMGTTRTRDNYCNRIKMQLTYICSATDSATERQLSVPCIQFLVVRYGISCSSVLDYSEAPPLGFWRYAYTHLSKPHALRRKLRRPANVCVCVGGGVSAGVVGWNLTEDANIHFGNQAMTSLLRMGSECSLPCSQTHN